MSKKIYTIDYLMNECLTDDDLHYLLDKRSLLYSLIIGEFREINSTLSDSEILSICKADTHWMYKYFWNKKQLNNFTDKLCAIYKNVYNYSECKCFEKAQWFIIMYGLTNKMQQHKKIKYLDE